MPCYYRCAAVLLYLLLLKALSYHQLHWPSMFWFINYLIYKSSKIYQLANNKKLINLDYLTCYCRCFVVLLYLPLLTILLDIISFLDFHHFIDLLIALFISLLKYIDLLIIKKLINSDHLAWCSYYAYCFQYFQIFFISLSNLLITIILINLDCLVIIAVIVCLILQLLSVLSYSCCPPRPIITNCLYYYCYLCG